MNQSERDRRDFLKACREAEARAPDAACRLHMRMRRILMVAVVELLKREQQRGEFTVPELSTILAATLGHVTVDACISPLVPGQAVEVAADLSETFTAAAHEAGLAHDRRAGGTA